MQERKPPRLIAVAKFALAIFLILLGAIEALNAAIRTILLAPLMAEPGVVELYWRKTALSVLAILLVGTAVGWLLRKPCAQRGH